VARSIWNRFHPAEGLDTARLTEDQGGG